MKTKEMAPQDQNLVAVVTTKGNPKKDSANLGLPEHKWCPPSSPRHRQSSPKAKVTHVQYLNSLEILIVLLTQSEVSLEVLTLKGQEMSRRTDTI